MRQTERYTGREREKQIERDTRTDRERERDIKRERPKMLLIIHEGGL